MVWKLNRQTGRQEYEVTVDPMDTPKGVHTTVHFIDSRSKRYVGKQSCRVLQGTLYPDKGVMMTPQAHPVTLHGDHWVHWIGAVPR
jgi:hypothetical protein